MDNRWPSNSLFGPHIGEEFAAAFEAAGMGRDVPFGYGSDGAINGYDDLEPEIKAIVDAVVAAHDPQAHI